MYTKTIKMIDYLFLILYIIAFLYFLVSYFSNRAEKSSQYKKLELKYLILAAIVLLIAIFSRLERMGIIDFNF